MSAERTDEQVVTEKWPEAQCQWTSRGWRVWAGNIDDGIIELGRTSSAHVPESEAWANAAKRLKARKLSKAEKEMYGCDG